jgi:carbon-monoxide dehydrogenase iron sulfur subunit
LHTLPEVKVTVEEVRGYCASRLAAGDSLIFDSGLIQIPKGKHFCLCALQAVLPFLPAKQRATGDEDWLKEYLHVICPEPEGNVLLRLETLPHPCVSSCQPGRQRCAC